MEKKTAMELPADTALELARVALDNGWAVMVVDRRVTRAVRYHAFRSPKDDQWFWADDVTDIIDRAQSLGYDRVMLIGRERGNLVRAWELGLSAGRLIPK